MQQQKNATKRFRLRVTADRAKSYHNKDDYIILTPHALCRALDNAYWKPGMRWVIDRIYMNAPILEGFYNGEEVLLNIDYIVDARIIVDAKHEREARRYYEQAFKNISARKYHKRPYFGNRDWHATIDIYDKFYIKPAYGDEIIDFGKMFYGYLDYGTPNQTEIYFRCEIKHGVIDVARSQKFKIVK